METKELDAEGSNSEGSDSDESEQVFLNYSKEQLLTYLGMSLSKFAESSSKLKLLKTQKDESAKKAEHFQALYENSLIKIEELENGSSGVCSSERQQE